jgi:hypothetical protein
MARQNCYHYTVELTVFKYNWEMEIHLKIKYNENTWRCFRFDHNVGILKYQRSIDAFTNCFVQQMYINKSCKIIHRPGAP